METAAMPIPVSQNIRITDLVAFSPRKMGPRILTCALHSGVDPNVFTFNQMYADQTTKVVTAVILIDAEVISTIAAVT